MIGAEYHFNVDIYAYVIQSGMIEPDKKLSNGKAGYTRRRHCHSMAFHTWLSDAWYCSVLLDLQGNKRCLLPWYGPLSVLFSVSVHT